MTSSRSDTPPTSWRSWWGCSARTGWRRSWTCACTRARAACRSSTRTCSSVFAPARHPYVHARDLGGLRVPLEGSPNDGWREEGFRGYADHMATAEFGAAIARLETLARERPTSVMCAEASWEHCHRRLLSDALVARGRRVRPHRPGRAAIRTRADGLRGRRRDGGRLPRAADARSTSDVAFRLRQRGYGKAPR